MPTPTYDPAFTMSKIQLTAHGTGDGPGYNARTDHLRPVIDFLLAQGNRPTGWRGDAFWDDQGGEMHYYFTQPLDADQLRRHFLFPSSIHLLEDGTIRDVQNRVDIGYEPPRRHFSFSV